MSTSNPSAPTGSQQQQQSAMEAEVAELESYFNSTLKECNRLAKREEVEDQYIAMAKMVNYAIRMLHSEGWLPRTTMLAMAKLEIENDRTVRGMMYAALRERRDERTAATVGAPAKRRAPRRGKAQRTSGGHQLRRQSRNESNSKDAVEKAVDAPRKVATKSSN